jgi:hypothetical protein
MPGHSFHREVYGGLNINAIQIRKESDGAGVRERTRGVPTGSGWERRPTALWKLARAYDVVVADDRFFRVTPLVINRLADISCMSVAHSF